jgi:hypothetical protein
MSQAETNETNLPSNADSTQEAVGATGEVLPAGTGPVTVRASAPKIHRYPNNLDTKEQPHSVNFFISEYVPGGNVDVLGAPSARSGNGITAENAKNVNDQLRVAAGFVGGLVGQQVGKKVGKAFGNFGETIGSIIGTGGGALLIDQVISNNATSIKTAPAKRLNTAISLHVAQSPQAKYTAEYENESIGALLGTLATSEGSGVIGSLMTEASNGNLGELVGRGLVDAATIPKELGLGNANFGGLARAASKKVRNPFQEQIFKTMNFRSFAFQYKFAPRNQSEFDSVMNIIKLFKFHMHPTKADGGAFFTFPSIFDIEYRYKGERNSFVNKIATSVLTDMSVDYGSEGVFTTFRGTKGQPSEITLAMQFREISLLTKGENGDLTNGTGTGY